MAVRPRPPWEQRELRIDAFKETGSLYGNAFDSLEEQAIRSELRRMGVPVDPVLGGARVLDEVYWEGDGADSYERRLRDYRVANAVTRAHVINHPAPRRKKRR